MSYIKDVEMPIIIEWRQSQISFKRIFGRFPWHIANNVNQLALHTCIHIKSSHILNDTNIICIIEKNTENVNCYHSCIVATQIIKELG